MRKKIAITVPGNGSVPTPSSRSTPHSIRGKLTEVGKTFFVVMDKEGNVFRVRLGKEVWISGIIKLGSQIRIDRENDLARSIQGPAQL
jgi:hypothetical protein